MLVNCLRLLALKGWVCATASMPSSTKVLRRWFFQKSTNSFKYIYLLTPQYIVEKVALTSRFLKHMMKEYEPLRPGIEVLEINVTSEAN